MIAAMIRDETNASGHKSRMFDLAFLFGDFTEGGEASFDKTVDPTTRLCDIAVSNASRVSELRVSRSMENAFDI
jgi:hypothetical protein